MASTKEQSPQDRKAADDKARCHYWISWIEAAKEAAKPSLNLADQAWKEYSKGKPKVDAKGLESVGTNDRFPLYWSSVKTIQPALYARTPIPVVEKAFDSLEDPIARLASVLAERFAKYLIRACPFDRVLKAARDEYIHSAKTTFRVFFESDIKEERTYFTPNEENDETGAPAVRFKDEQGNYAAPDTELTEDEDGRFYTTTEDLRSVKVTLVPLHRRDVIHTPNARHHEEIDAIAYRSRMKKKQVETRFGKDVADKLTFTALEDDKEDKGERKKGIPDQFATIWEIWDDTEKKTLWVCEDYSECLLDEREDPYELEGFFPSPAFMLGTTNSDDLYATSDYAQLEPLIAPIHGMLRRLRRLLIAVKRRGIYDGSHPDLDVLNSDTDEADFIKVRNFKQLIGDGGLEKIIQYFPVQELVEATAQLVEMIQVFKNEFNEIWGISDIVRGTSDARETAAAQQLKGNYFSHRLSETQREMQRLCRDGLQLMIDLALKKFPEQKLMSCMGYQYLKPEEQQIFPHALQLLKSDSERLIRIAIETDSTITMNQNAEIEQRNYLVKTLLEGIAAIANTEQQNNRFVPVVMESILFAIRGVRDGKQIEESLRTGMQQAMQPQQQGPDPEAMKAQGQLQLAQAKAQMEMQVMQMKVQAEMILEREKAMSKMQLEMADAANQQRRVELEGQLAVMKAQQEADIKMFTAMSNIEAKRAESEQKMEIAASQQKEKSAGSKESAGGKGKGDVHVHFGGAA